MATDLLRSRTAVAVGGLLLSTVLAGCGLLGNGDETDASTCGDRDWCYYVPGEGHTDGAYQPAMSFVYCQVAEVRQRVVDGDLDLGDLPDWADTGDRGGAPIVIDFATLPTTDFDRRADDLTIHFEDIGQPLDPDGLRTCVDGLTQRDIEATDGKRQAG